MSSQDAAARLVQLEQEIDLIEDRRAIRRLQYLYGYYVDNHMWHEMVDLFCHDEPSMEVGERGNYIGEGSPSHSSCRRLWQGTLGLAAE